MRQQTNVVGVDDDETGAVEDDRATSGRLCIDDKPSRFECDIVAFALRFCEFSIWYVCSGVSSSV